MSDYKSKHHVSQRFSSWSSFSSHLDSLGLFRMKPGRSRMEQGSALLGLSHETISRMGMVHLVGTNGKGSTAAFLESIARAHGKKTGLFTSPHFISPLERIRINGRALTTSDWIDLANTIYAACPDIDFSYFELLTLMAMVAFIRANVDFVIMEAGLGGTWDSTTVFDYDLTILTPIGLDHESILGPDIETIATDKAGAIRGGQVLCGYQEKSVEQIIRTQADKKTAVFHRAMDHAIQRDGRLSWIDHDRGEISLAPEYLGLSGAFQQKNSLLALDAWSIFTRFRGWPFLPLKCREGLACVKHPGRMQIIHGAPTFLLDGAHNLMGLQALHASLQAMNFVADCMIFSCMEDKNIRQRLDLVKKLCAGDILIPNISNNERAINAQTLASCMGSRAIPCNTMQEALQRIADKNINVLVCGSLYLLGDFFRARPDDLIFR